MGVDNCFRRNSYLCNQEHIPDKLMKYCSIIFQQFLKIFIKLNLMEIIVTSC